MPARFRGLVLLASASAGVFLGALDQTVVATLLPPIIQQLEIPFTRLDDAAWIVTAYLLGYTVALPVVGRLADLHGRIGVFIGCLLVFVVASIGCGLAPTLEWLIAARTVQAAGGGALLPIALALAGDLPEAGRRSVALGLVAGLAEAGGVLGPLYGALIVQWLDWRWVFYLNVPLGVLTLGGIVWAARRGPAAAQADATERASSVSFDLAGALLLTVALAALTIALSREAGPQLRPALFVVAIAGALTFLHVERGARQPLFELDLFKSLPFAAAMATSLLTGAALIVVMVNVPLWAATVLGRDATQGGLLLLRLTLPIPVGAVLGGLGTRHIGPRAVTLVGLLGTTGAFLLMAAWPAEVTDATLTRDLALAGLGFGLLLAPLAGVAIGWAGPARGAVAAALVVVARMLGMTLGLSALTAYGLGRFETLVRDVPLPLARVGETAAALAQRQAEYGQLVQAATVTTFHELFLAAAVLCAIAVAPALLLRSPR